MEQFPASAAEPTEKRGANKKMAADDFLLLQSFSPIQVCVKGVGLYLCVLCESADV